MAFHPSSLEGEASVAPDLFFAWFQMRHKQSGWQSVAEQNDSPLPARCTRSPRTAAMWRRRRARWCGTIATQTQTSAIGRCRPGLLHTQGCMRHLPQEVSGRTGVAGGPLNALPVVPNLCRCHRALELLHCLMDTAVGQRDLPDHQTGSLRWRAVAAVAALTSSFSQSTWPPSSVPA